MGGWDFFVSGIAGGLCAVWAQAQVPETLQAAQRKPFSPKVKGLFSFLKLFGQSKDLNIGLIMMFLCDVSLRTGAIFSMYTKMRFKWDAEITGRWLMLYGLGMAFSPGYITKPVQEALSSRGLLYFTIIGACIAEWMLALSKNGKMFMAALPVFFLSLGKPPAIRAMVTRAANEALPSMGQGELAGCQSSIGSLSNLVSPQIHAKSFAYFASEQAPFYFPSMPFAICGASDVLNVLLLWNISEKTSSWVKQKKEKKAEKEAKEKKVA